jgi:hypothetical protein
MIRFSSFRLFTNTMDIEGDSSWRSLSMHVLGERVDRTIRYIEIGYYPTPR